MHETIIWFESIREKLSEFSFELVGQHTLPKHFWWTDFGAPLQERIQAYRETHGDATESPKLAEYKGIVADIKSSPDRVDSGIYLMRKRPFA